MVDDAGTVVDLNGSTRFETNSIRKLFTAAGALLELGAGFRFRTEVHAAGRRHADGVLAGDLVVVASGDPTFTADDLTRLCEAVAAAGIRRVGGGLVVDDTRHDHRRSVPGWEPYYVPDFTGPLSAFAIDRNRNCRDGAFLADPATANAELVRLALLDAGVVVGGPTRVGPAAVGAGSVVAQHLSDPLSHIVRSVLLRSDTFSAEMLLKELGAGGGGGGRTTAGGLAVLKAVAAGLAADRAGATEVDGSGLSARNVDSPHRHVAWLQAVERTPVGERFRRALPVAGESGTLSRRFLGTPAVGRVHAKSGTRRRNGTVNLAGYATSLDGRRLWFSFVLTGARSHGDAMAAVDRAVVSLVAGPA